MRIHLLWWIRNVCAPFFPFEGSSTELPLLLNHVFCGFEIMLNSMSRICTKCVYVSGDTEYTFKPHMLNSHCWLHHHHHHPMYTLQCDMLQSVEEVLFNAIQSLCERISSNDQFNEHLLTALAGFIIKKIIDCRFDIAVLQVSPLF